MSFFKYIFSIEDNETNTLKIIRIFGLKLKINRYKFFNQDKIKINDNKIVFSNYFGKSYGCNPKYITEEILKQNLPYEIVWLVKDKDKERENFPQQIRLENYFSPEGFKELLSAKVWVDNMRKPYFWSCGLKKKEGQFYLQTWHAAIGIKKMEGDVEKYSKWWRKWAKVDSQNIDCIISDSKFLTDLYTRENCFWYCGRVEQIGHPRNDIFFKSDSEKQKIIDKVYSKLGLNKNVKIVLYVPTYRDDKDISCLNLDFNKLKKSLEGKFGGEYAVAVRLHPNVPISVMQKFSDINIVNANNYSDIQELLLASDVAITDYSSCVFDFMLTKRPVFIYASDIEKYNTARGFYYPLDSTPFLIATNNEQIVENISNFDYDEYRNNVELFLKEKGCTEDGNASERAVAIVKEYMERNNK